MTLQYPPRIALAQLPTPLEPLDRLSEQLGGPRIWVKRDDLTGCVASGNKIRKLEFTLAKAIEQGCDTLITCGGLQSNHCRTTAVLASKLGLKVHLILRGREPQGVSDGNLFIDQLAGAEISYYPAPEYQSSLNDILAQWQQSYASQGHKAWIIPTGASDGVGVWGYIRCCEELRNDFARLAIQPKHIITASGSGGTQAGLTAGSALHQLNAAVYGINVCDDENYFLHKVRQDLLEWRQLYNQGFDIDIDSLDIQVIDGYVGPAYAKAGPEIFETIKKIAQLEGLILDPVYTGKAFYGMLQELKQGRFGDSGDIVFIHTGGLFGLFAQRDQVAF